jgi:hypothetical protein
MAGICVKFVRQVFMQVTIESSVDESTLSKDNSRFMTNNLLTSGRPNSPIAYTLSLPTVNPNLQAKEVA